MKRPPISRLWRAATAALLALYMAPEASAVYRTDFYQTSPAPTICYDAPSQTWTLANAAIRRVVRFDAATGGLRTEELTDLRAPENTPVRIVSDGALTLEMPGSGPTVALSDGWKMTATKPAGDWTAPGYDDSAWTPATLPYKSDTAQKSWWFRHTLLAETGEAGERKVLVLDHSVDDGAEVFVDGKPAGSLPASEYPWTKVYTFDLPAGARTIAIRLDGGGPPNALSSVFIGEAGRKATLSLDHGWRLGGHTEKDGELTVRLQGTGENAGFDLDASYRVFAGDEPVIARRYTLTSFRPETWLLAGAVYDRCAAFSGKLATQAFNGSGLAVSSTASGRGFATAVLSYQGASAMTDGGRRVETVYRPYLRVEPGVPVSIPEAVLGLYEGPTAAGGFLLQLYVGAHVSRGTPTTVPPLYSTWFGYYSDINEDLLLKLIPKAADLGVKNFAVDDGWQALKDGKTWGYGDWAVNATRFPNGLKPIAEAARKNGLGLGLWSAPIMAHDTSGLTAEHPEWLIRKADGKTMPLWGGTSAYCFTGPYAAHYREWLLKTVNDLDLASVKLDGGLYVDGCVADGHDHPASHAEAEQISTFAALCDDLHKTRPGIVVDRGWEGEPGLTATYETSWFGDWAVAFHPEREADPLWWYRNADIYRRTLYNVTFVRPPYTISWEAPCHVLCKPVDLNALEYHLTSIGAYICNLEIHGRLLEATPEEIALTKKWVRWNAENREWLAYTQPITALGQPYDAQDDKATPHMDGVLHLRNALRGRYGYICLWNPGGAEATATVPVHPADYRVRMDPSRVKLVRLKDGKDVPFTATPGGFAVSVPMASRSWEILEVRQAWSH